MNEQSHFDIPEIKERVKIWDVMKAFGHEAPELCKAVRSPLREERHPSFSIFAGGMMAKDHATGEAYDCILLYMALAGCSKHEAIVGCGKLAGLAPGELPPELSVPPPPRSQFTTDFGRKRGQKERRDFRAKLGDYTPEIKEQMIVRALQFLSSRGDNILKAFCYLKGIDPKFMARMAQDGLVGVCKHPVLYSPAIAWLFESRRFGPGCKLRMEADSSRKTMWWHGRSQEHFFGEQLLKPVVLGDPELPRVIVTEGESDTLTLLQLGIPAIGVTGAGVIPDHLATHSCLAFRNIGVWYDADHAGREATMKMQKQILQHATGATVFNGIGSKTPEGLDIGDCWMKWPKDFARYAKSELDRMEKYNQPTTLD